MLIITKVLEDDWEYFEGSKEFLEEYNDELLESWAKAKKIVVWSHGVDSIERDNLEEIIRSNLKTLKTRDKIISIDK